MSTSPMKGTSPPSAATPAPRERRHDAATKSDTAPWSASPVDRYPTRASATLKRRSDDSIDGSPTSHYMFDQPPTCPLPTLAELRETGRARTSRVSQSGTDHNPCIEVRLV